MKDLLLKLKMIADNVEFNRNIRQSNKELSRLDGSANGAGSAIRKAGRAGNIAADSFRDQAVAANKAAGSVDGLSGKYSIAASVAKAFAASSAIAITAIGAGIGTAISYGRELANANKELNLLSQSLQISKDALQVWGKAGETAGFNLSNIGDIFKDINDKAGDFAATGGGEAKEIIERLNIDIKELIGLPADQKLLKIAGAFDELGDSISLEEKTFLLEAMGNDASRLLPLLENNAEKLREIERISRESGAILDEQQLATLDEAQYKLQLIGLSADGLKNEIGTIGAEFINAFGDDAAAAIQYITELIDYAEHSAKALAAEISESWLFASQQMQDAAGDSFTSATDLAKRATEESSMLAGFMFESFVDGYTYLPTIASASYSAAVSSATAWLHENDAAYQAFKGATASAMAAVLDYTRPAFSGMADIGGKSIAFIISRLADLMSGIRAVSYSLSNIPGFENITAGVSAVEGKLRSMAAEAEGAGAAVAASTSEAANKLRDYAKNAEFASVRQRKLAAEAKLSAIEALSAADSFIELSKAKRQDAALKYEERLTAERHAIKKKKSALDEYTSTVGRARINEEAINEALSKGTKTAKKATKQRKKLTEAEREAERLRKKRLADAERLRKAQKEELKSLDLQEKKLRLNEVAYYRASLEARNFSQEVIDQAVAHKKNNILLEESIKLADEYASINLNKFQQYEHDLVQRGIDPEEASSKAAEKRRASYEAITKELSQQHELLGKSWEDQRDIRLEAEGYNEEQRKLIIQQEKSLKLREQEIAAIDSIKNGLQSAIQSAISGDGFDFDAIADGIQQSFTDRVFNAAFEADFGNANSLADLVNGFKGNSFGKNIASYAGQFGVNGFSGAGNYANWQYGAASMAGGYAGEALFGSGGDVGGSIGAGIGMAMAGPVGAAVGTALGGFVGSVFGGKYEYDGNGVRLGYSGGEFAGNKYTDETKEGGLLGSDKHRRNYDALDGSLEATLDDYFDAVEESLVAQAESLSELGIGAGGDAAQTIIDNFGSGAATALQTAADSSELFGSGLFASMFHEMFAEVANVTAEEMAAAQASFEEIDLTGKSAEEQQRLINEWAEDTQNALYQAVFAEDYDALIALADKGETSSEAIGRLINQYSRLNEVTEIIGGTFDATGTEALEASDAIIELFGGIDQLASSTSFFYENYFTEEERKNKLIQKARETTADLNTQLSDMGFGTIKTRQDLRDLVAGLDETSEEGQKAYHIAMQLARSFDVLADAEEAAADAAAEAAAEQARLAEEQAEAARRLAEQQAALAKSLRGEIASLAAGLFDTAYDPSKKIAAIRTRISEEERRIDEMNNAVQSRYDAELDAYKSMQSAATGIADYLDSLKLSAVSILNPFDKMREAQAQYQDLLRKARRGDVEAATKLKEAAATYLENARGYYASSDEYTGIFNNVNSDLATVEKIMSAMPEPMKPADITSAIIPRLERQIDAIEAHVAFQEKQNIAGELAGKLQELALATGEDIATLAGEFDISIQRLATILSGDKSALDLGGADSGKGDSGKPEKKPVYSEHSTANDHDTNGDGVLTYNEFERFRQGDSSFKPADKDRDGHVSTSEYARFYQEFVALRDELGKPSKASSRPTRGGGGGGHSAPAKINTHYDLNRDGKISFGELLNQRKKEGKRFNGYDVGSDYIQGDQIAQIHNAEMIFTAEQSGSIRDSVVSALKGLSVIAEMTGGNDAGRTDALINRLIQENQQIKQALAVLIDNMNDNADSAEDAALKAVSVLEGIRDNTERRVTLRGAA